MKTHKIRIIAGTFKGRKLSVYEAEGLRPTTDRVRVTLFNWLAPIIRDKKCLDLFAGSGALGIEALSRGAAHCLFVEKHKKVSQILKENVSFVEKKHYAIINNDANQFISQQKKESFDIIFFDPPYGMEEAPTLLKRALSLLNNNGIIYLESHDDTLALESGLVAKKTLCTKNISCGLYIKRPSTVSNPIPEDFENY